MTVETEALGGRIDFGGIDRQPQVRGITFNSPDDMDINRELLHKGRIPLVLDALARAKKKYDTIIPVVSSIVGPFTLCTQLFGFENVLIWIIEEPDTLRRAMAKTTALSIMYASEQIAAGCDVVQVGEAACSGDLISGKDYGEFIAPCHKEIGAALSVPAVIHICGCCTGHLPYIADTGMAGFSFDEKTDIKQAAALLKGKVALVGYVPTLEVLLNESPESVREKTRNCIQAGVDVVNAGCAWPPHVKGENIKALVDAVQTLK